MNICTMLRRAALFAAAPVLLAVVLQAHEPVPRPETDVPPTEADQRFKAKYGIWPPHITYEHRKKHQERARSADRAKHARTKNEKPPARLEAEGQ